LSALLHVVEAALAGGALSLTQLGRRRPGAAHEKHQIKAVDRLLGNHHLHREHDRLYAAIATQVIGGIARPVIVVDWSDFEPGRRWAMLKAAIPLKGRAITVYARVFPFRRYNSPGAHREFLRALHAVLPESCRPIVVTDAGFRGPWFRQVQSYGWDWVGRVRNGIKFFNEATGRWCYSDSLYRQATPKIKHLGERTLGRRRGYRCRLYLVRAHVLRLGRPPKRHRGTKPNETMYRRLHRAPWLLATSLPHQRGSERRIKRLYEQRMQIEETLRDTKSHRIGLGLRYCRCNSGERLQVLLLIAALAALVLWLAGLCAKELGWSRRFQANTERRRNVLSVVFLGRRLLLRYKLALDEWHLRRALQSLRDLVLDALPV
jgi:hypothetical protein